QDAFLELPVAPHVDTVPLLAIIVLDGDLVRQAQHLPEVAHSGAGPDDHPLAADPALARLHRPDRARPVHGFEPGDLDSGHDPDTELLDLVGEGIHGAGLVRVTAALLVQDSG